MPLHTLNYWDTKECSMYTKVIKFRELSKDFDKRFDRLKLLGTKAVRFHEAMVSYINKKYGGADVVLGRHPFTIREKMKWGPVIYDLKPKIGLVRAFLYGTDLFYGGKLRDKDDLKKMDEILEGLALEELEPGIDIKKVIAERHSVQQTTDYLVNSNKPLAAMIWKVVIKELPEGVRKQLKVIDDYLDTGDRKKMVAVLKALRSVNPDFAQSMMHYVLFPNIIRLSVPQLSDEERQKYTITFSAETEAALKTLSDKTVERIFNMDKTQMFQELAQDNVPQRIQRIERDGKEYIVIGKIELPVRQPYVGHVRYQKKFAGTLGEIHSKIEPFFQLSREAIKKGALPGHELLLTHVRDVFDDEKKTIFGEPYIVDDYQALKEIILDEAYTQLFIPGEDAVLEQYPEQIGVLEDMAAALKYKLPFYMVGETGAGKTALITYLCHLTGNALRRFNASGQTEKSELIGEPKPYLKKDKDGNEEMSFKWFDNVLTESVKLGHIFYIDEINLAKARVYTKMNSLLDDERRLLINESGKNEIVNTHEDFWLCAASNPVSETGRNKLAEDLRNRFLWRYVDELSPTSLVSLIEKRYHLPNELVQDLVSFHMEMCTLGREKKIARISPEDIRYTVRNLKRLAKRLEARQHADGEIPKAALLKELKECYAALFDNEEDLKLFWDRINMHLGYSEQDLPAEHIELTIDEKKKTVTIGEVTLPIQEHTDPEILKLIPKDEGKLVLNQTSLYWLEKIFKTEKFGEFLCLVGETATAKTSLIRESCRLTRSGYVRVTVDESTDTDDFIGAWQPTEDGFKFTEAILIQAMRKGLTIVIDEANVMKQEIMERINSLLDDAGNIVITENGNRVPVYPKPGFRLVFTINPSTYEGRHILSCALRNKLQIIHVDDRYSEEEQVEIFNSGLIKKDPDLSWMDDGNGE